MSKRYSATFVIDVVVELEEDELIGDDVENLMKAQDRADSLVRERIDDLIGHGCKIGNIGLDSIAEVPDE